MGLCRRRRVAPDRGLGWLGCGAGVCVVGGVGRGGRGVQLVSGGWQHVATGGGETVVLAPPDRLIDRLFAELLAHQRPSSEEGLALFLRLLINVTKLHLVAIHPNHRGYGHGQRLVRHGLDLARRSLVINVFGEYLQDRPPLAHFYSSLGFAVLAPGDHLDLSAYVGIPFRTYAQPGER
jgi:GNAT superfamily N-acetyltransferase